MIKPYVFIACCFTVVIFIVGFGAMLFMKPAHMSWKEKIGWYSFFLVSCSLVSFLAWNTLAKAELSALVSSTMAVMGSNIQDIVGEEQSTTTTKFNTTIRSIDDFFYTPEEVVQLSKETCENKVGYSEENFRVSAPEYPSWENDATEITQSTELPKVTQSTELPQLSPVTSVEDLSRFKEELEARINAYPTDTPEQEVEKIEGMYRDIQGVLEGLLDDELSDNLDDK